MKINITKTLHQLLNPMNSLETHVNYLIGDIENLLTKFDDSF